ncbi:sporulation related protein [Palleronia aestuarii]|uniref:Sporulation related protein n=1 Tax=Palleronia aestuarii TaxID=568105 RepID=A0A2W7NAU0_9RHOB|nr:serine protease [Palleronia aestuarii]PZX15217.1 sporulation related protein [Palleronia aestuarii]
MRHLIVATLACILAIASQPAAAQDNYWLQIAARPSAAEATRDAENYAARLDGVRGFRIGSGRWHAIVIGPFGRAEAERRRRDLITRGLVPRDAFVTDGESFRASFFSSGSDRPSPAVIEPPRRNATEPGTQTPAEARRAERALSSEARREVQAALRSAGFYDGAIDGAFGPGTRRAMAAWQRANDHAETGVLTTTERTALLRAHRAILEGLGMARIRDDEAGIALDMPTERLAFERYEAPFAHYPARAEDDTARLLLISRPGDRTTLRGLYDVLQSLEIVPPDGARSLRGDAFTIEGRSAQILSHTEARLADGAIKGFTLVWPADEETQWRRVVAEMQASFSAIPGVVLAEDAGFAGEAQSIDLLAGLAIRQPDIERTGFYVTADGRVLTSADAVAGCRRITLDDGVEARAEAVDPGAGLALLSPLEPLAPRARAAFRRSVPRLGTEILAAGFPFGGALPAPSLTEGRLADLRGLDGEEDVHRFDLGIRPGDAGGPILDPAGAVLGVLLPRPGAAERRLPPGVAFAADVGAIEAFLTANGVQAQQATATAPLPAAQIETLAADLATPVGCWK